MSRNNSWVLMGLIGLYVGSPALALAESPFEDGGMTDIQNVLERAPDGGKSAVGASAVEVISGVQERLIHDGQGGTTLKGVVHTVGHLQTKAGKLWFKTGRGPEASDPSHAPDFAYEIDLCLMDEQGQVLFRRYGGHDNLVPECGALEEERAYVPYDPALLLDAAANAKRVAMKSAFASEQAALQGTFRLFTEGNKSPSSTAKMSIDTCPNPPTPGQIKHVLHMYHGEAFNLFSWSSSPRPYKDWLAEHAGLAGFVCEPGNPFPGRQDGLWPQWNTGNHGRAPGDPNMSFKCEARSGWRPPQSTPFSSCDQPPSPVTIGGVPGPWVASLGGHNSNDDAYVQVRTFLANAVAGKGVCLDAKIRRWAPGCDGSFRDLLSECGF